MSWTPPPGTIGLTYPYGFTAIRAAFGHRLLTDPSSYTHAFIVLGNGLIAEPWPNGARVVPLHEFDKEDVAFGWLPGLPPERQQAIVDAATHLLGTGYSVLDYWALWRFRNRKSLNKRVIRRVTSTDHLLPAQFVAEAYRQAGIHLLPGQNCQDVTIGQLGALFLRAPQWELRVPCTLYV